MALESYVVIKTVRAYTPWSNPCLPPKLFINSFRSWFRSARRIFFTELETTFQWMGRGNVAYVQLALPLSESTLNILWQQFLSENKGHVLALILANCESTLKTWRRTDPQIDEFDLNSANRSDDMVEATVWFFTCLWSGNNQFGAEAWVVARGSCLWSEVGSYLSILLVPL